jgi:hypothetical protein
MGGPLKAASCDLNEIVPGTTQAWAPARIETVEGIDPDPETALPVHHTHVSRTARDGFLRGRDAAPQKRFQEPFFGPEGISRSFEAKPRGLV